MSEHRTEKATSGQPDLPPLEPNFIHIVESIAVAALIWTGHLRNPMDENVEPDLEKAKFQISLLEILETKTKGNLDKDEEEFLANMLHNVRLAYVRASEQKAAAHAAGAAPGAPEAAPGVTSEAVKKEGQK